MRVARAIVTAVIEESLDIQRLLVSACGDADCPQTCAEARRAVNYPALTGHAACGDAVWVNCTARDLALGTGGWDIVTCVEGPGFSAPDAGHIMKLRYAPSQVSVRCVEEQGSPWHDALADAFDCAGLPVACCELHSQAMAVAAAAHEADPGLRIAYVMTDEAALLLALSDTCRALREAGVLAGTFTCGQATGGEHEAVSLHSALVAARVMGFDAAVVSMGPGIVGTATALGHGGVAQGEAVNACAVVGARALACVRASLADPRARHHGISHHAACALGRVALAPATLPLPAPLCACARDAALLEGQLADGGLLARHRRRDVAVPVGTSGVSALLGDARITTMGCGVAEDVEFFRFCVACGLELARMAGEGVRDGMC